MTEQNKKNRRIESLGWGMWLVCFAIAYGPFHYMGWRISEEDQKSGMLPFIIGFVCAAFLAGVLTTAANAILQKYLAIQQKTERKKKKKRK